LIKIGTNIKDLGKEVKLLKLGGLILHLIHLTMEANTTNMVQIHTIEIIGHTQNGQTQQKLIPHIHIHHLKAHLTIEIGGGTVNKMLLGAKKEGIGKMVNMYRLM
jgi:hypothetical protein